MLTLGERIETTAESLRNMSWPIASAIWDDEVPLWITDRIEPFRKQALDALTIRTRCETCDTTGHADPANANCINGYTERSVSSVVGKMVEFLYLCREATNPLVCPEGLAGVEWAAETLLALMDPEEEGSDGLPNTRR